MIGYYEQSEFEQQQGLFNIIHSSVVSDRNVVHPHWHSHMEILVVRSGKALMQMDNRYEEISSGDMILIGCNRIHGVYPLDGQESDIKVYQINIKNIVNSNVLAYQNVHKSLGEGLDVPIKLKEGTESNLKINEILVNVEKVINQVETKDIEEEKQEQQEGELVAYEVLICQQQIILLELIIYLLRNYKSKEVTHNYIASERARKALDQLLVHIDSGYMNVITLDEAAKLIGYSKTQLNRLMHNATGYPFIEYLNKVRVDQSIRKMLQGDTSTEAAFESGFNSLSSFNRYFRRFKKLSPREYMKNQ